MDTLTQGIQQLVMYSCGSLFLGWFALQLGNWLYHVLIDRIQDWIGD